MFSRSSLVDVHLAYKIKNIVSKCSGVPSSVLANTLQAAGQHIFSQRLKPQSDDTINQMTLTETQKPCMKKSPAARVIM